MGILAIPPNSRRAFAWALALLATAAAAQWALRSALAGQVPFLFLLPAVGIAAMWCGTGPGLLVLAGGLVNALFWMQGGTGLALHQAAGQVALAGYLAAGGLLTLMGGRISALRARAAQAEERLSAQVSDLQALHEALRAATTSSRRLEVALETSAVPFCLLSPLRDAQGEITTFRWEHVNAAAARMLRRAPSEVGGQPVRATLDPDVRVDPESLGHAVEALRSRRTVRYETWMEAAGRRRWFDVIASPCEDLLALWFSDVTERREQQEALREADRRKDEFLATLAHELRNPLAPVRQAALIARSSAADEDKKQWAHGVIERQVGHMAMLLDDLLDVSRITRGKLELRKAPVRLDEVVDAALEAVRPAVEARGHTLQLRLPDEPLWLDADRLRVAQVLSNLLGNACKYTPEGGRISLAVWREDRWAVLEVRDNGGGIAPDALERIFEMFTQVREDAGGRTGGLGIGLALSRGLVELHGGTLGAASAGPGQGSTFTVRLPLAAAPQAPARPVASRPAPGRARRVLVADDNRDAAQSLADLLRMEGHEVTLAFDGRDALQACERVQPQVALLDIGMPHLSGNDVARAIRGRPWGQRVLLVAITGWGQERDRAAAREAGFDRHFTKPVDPQQVLALLASEAAAPEVPGHVLPPA